MSPPVPANRSSTGNNTRGRFPPGGRTRLALRPAQAAWILFAVASADTAEARGASVLPVYLEVFLVPGVLVLALVRSFDRTTRAWAGGLAIGTLLGALAVAVVTLAVTA